MRALWMIATVAVAGCSKVDRYGPPPQSSEPSPAQQDLERGGQPSARSRPSTKPAAPPPSTPHDASGCPADRVDKLVATVDDRNCSTGDDSCKTDCASGDVSACFFRASALQSDPARESEMVTLFGRSCELGLAIGCTNYGAIVWGRGGDAACARRAFDKACAVDEPFSCGMIGRMMISQAKGDATALASARSYLEQTCQRMGGPPCKMLANHLAANELGAFDQSELRPLLQRACEGGDQSACNDLR